MSSDNWYHIVRAGDEYVPIHYFMSSPGPLTPKDGMPRFPTLEAAMKFALDDYTEYGVSFSEEIWKEITNERNG